MAFSFQTFNVIGAGKNAPQLCMYKSTGETVATISGSGYFNGLNKTLATGDLIYAVGSNGARLLAVTVSAAGVVTTAAANVPTDVLVFA